MDLMFDIAVDPLEGTNFVANNLPGGFISYSCSQKKIIFLMHRKLIWIKLLLVT